MRKFGYLSLAKGINQLVCFACLRRKQFAKVPLNSKKAFFTQTRHRLLRIATTNKLVAQVKLFAFAFGARSFL